MMGDEFDYQLTKDERVLIYWRGKLVKTLAGDKAQKFLRQVESGEDEQAVMARVTGNFKRGNERDGKRKKGDRRRQREDEFFESDF